MRFVPPLAALAGRPVTFTGDEGALVRPMAALLDALRQQGVEVTCHGQEGFLPFTVHGNGLRGGTVTVDASGSSQFVSALLLTAVRADFPLTIRHVGEHLPSLPHIEMTLALLRECGIDARHEVTDGYHEWTVTPGELRLPDPVTVEPDLSNAGPFIAAALVAGGTISIENWPKQTTQPGDEFRRILPLMGARVERIGPDVEFSGTGPLRGIDIDLAHELAADLSMKVEFVDSSFASLVPDLVGDRCDIAMFAVAMLAQRMQHLRFTRPYLRSDIYAITTRGSATIKQWADIDRPGILVGVQSGTFMEPVMAASLKYAKLINIKPPHTRERELEAGRIDVFMTDYPYSRRLLDNADWATLISPPKPFHVMPYGYAVKPGDESWYAVVDDFVARIQKDGRLESHARRHGLDSMVVQP